MPFNGSASSMPPPRRPERVLAVAALATVLFLQPFLGIFDQGAGATLAGIPVLFVYLFVAWVIIVVLTALVMESRLGDEAGGPRGADEPAPPASGHAAGRESHTQAPAAEPEKEAVTRRYGEG